MMSKNEINQLKEEAKACYPKTEEVLKYFTNRIEQHRIRLGIPVADFAEILGLPSKYVYVQMFQAVKRGLGVYSAFAIVQFCLLFGYDLNPSDKKAANTTIDRACDEMAALLGALPESTLRNVAGAITGDQEIPPQLRKDYSRTLSRFIATIYPKDDADTTLNYRHLILSPENQSETDGDNDDSGEEFSEL